MVLIGFLMITNFTFACGKIASKTSCSIKSTVSCCKMKCCQKKSKTNSDKRCEGKCGKSNCQIQTISLVTILPEQTTLTINHFLVLTLKQVFYTSNQNPDSGFYSIWSPPNIG